MSFAELPKRRILNALASTRRELDMAMWAYVVMPERVHVLLCPRRPTTALKSSGTPAVPAAEKGHDHASANEVTPSTTIASPQLRRRWATRPHGEARCSDTGLLPEIWVRFVIFI